MFDFIRIACAVPKTSVAGVSENAEEICKKLRTAGEKRADIVVFPELAVTAYTCGDLFFQKTLLNSSMEAMRKIIAAASEYPEMTVAVGAPAEINGQLYNCGFVIYGGKVRGIVPKTFLPNYSEFYEKRWFSSADDLDVSVISAYETGLADSPEEDYEIPVGKDLIFSLSDKCRFGVEICEDLWTPLPPSTFLALGGAEVILNLSASNETIAKREYRRNLVSSKSASDICGYVYVSAGGGESTTDLIFSGHSLIAENGSVICESAGFIETDSMIISELDLGRIRADRMKNKSFKDCAKTYGSKFPCRTVRLDRREELCGDGSLYPIRSLPFVPSNKKDRIERCLNIFRMQVAGLKKRMEITGGKPVIGVSGGLDSTLALLVSAEAARQSGRPLTDVVGITMPCFGTTGRTYNNSLTLMKTLGITCHEIDIKAAVMQHFSDIGHDPEKTDLVYENSQARERTQVLMDYAGKVGGFVVGTGDLSELALGWCTYNADHMSMYGVNASIPKTLIRWMIDSLVEYDIFHDSTDVLKDVLDTPISPELLPPDAEGKIAQQTEDIVGPYALHDFFLYYVLRFGFEPEKIYYLAKKAFAEDFDDETILKWLKTFYRRFFTQQFKRSCLPDGVKVGSVCLSPRGDWRMPSDATAKEWLSRLRQAEPAPNRSVN
ncbi:MAG: NAD(+) synthase [Huintestinicola sp.]